MLIALKFSQQIIQIKNHCSFRSLTTRIGIIGVPFEKGQRKTGVSSAPYELRKAGLKQIFQKNTENFIVKDYGDISYKPEEICEIESIKNLNDVLGCNRAIYYKIQEILNENEEYLMIGGDHSTAIGSVGGHLNSCPNLILIWIDAHADIHTDLTSPSGNIHGMPLSFLVKELENKPTRIPKLNWIKNKISASNIIYIGLRDVDDAEANTLKEFNIKNFNMSFIRKNGIENVKNNLMEILNSFGNLPIHISFDIDALDPTEAPSTGTPVENGLSLKEAKYLLQNIYQTNQVSGIDLVEVNPKIGNENDCKQTIKASLEIIKSIYEKI